MPAVIVAVQSAVQLIPDRLLVMVPEPGPDCVIESVAFAAVNANDPVTVVKPPARVSVHGDVPLQPPPLHPVNVEPVSGAGVSVTVVPDVKRKGPPHVPESVFVQ